MTKYTLPQLCQALNKRGFKFSPFSLRSRLLQHAPEQLEQSSSGRYSILVEDETALRLLAHRLLEGA